MRAIIFAFGVASAALSLGAQPSTTQPPTFRAATDLVEVDVVAQSKDGRFVADLRREEFELHDEGHPQPLDFLYLVESNSPRLAAKEATADADATGGVPQTIRPGTPRVFVAFFDNRHLTPGGFKRVQAAALTLFSKELRAGDIGAIVSEGHLANDRFTTNREELVRAVQTARPGQRATARRFDNFQWPRMSDIEAVRIVMNNDSSVLAAATQRACADEPALCQYVDAAVRGKAAQLATDVRAETAQTVQTLLSLLRGLSQFEGRKTVLLLTEGFLAQESWPLVQDAVAEAARANARLYTLDARGLDRSRMSEHLTGFFPRDEGSSVLLKQLDFSEDAMNSLAVDSG
ncbi:MAG TPA: VWA domain-containing protein, partial [Vicinamibacterales bacterium]|nr:VWA domain-containing protein [Vicinamibacterales bacterium]